MSVLTMNLGAHSYPITVEEGALAQVGSCFSLRRRVLILTDSGGIQEEAPSLGKPVLVMRDTTERPEAVTAGTVRLVGTDKQRIVEEVTRLLKDENEYQAMSRAHNPYGDGQACSRILEALKNNRISL